MTIWIVSDTHFYHRGSIKNWGAANRPFFSVDEMNQKMKSEWNGIVRPDDTIYHFGDVAMWTPAQLEIVKELNGRKILIPGNHDTFHYSVYIKAGFADICGMKEFGGDGVGNAMIVCTHAPVHPHCLATPTRPAQWQYNVHGHIHERRVMKRTASTEEVDPRYLNVCVEHTGYAPITLEEVRARLAQQNGVELGYGHGV